MSSDVIGKSGKLHVVHDTYTEIRQMVEMQLRGAALKLVYGLFEEEMNRLFLGTQHRRRSNCGTRAAVAFHCRICFRSCII